MKGIKINDCMEVDRNIGKCLDKVAFEQKRLSNIMIKLQKLQGRLDFIEVKYKNMIAK